MTVSRRATVRGMVALVAAGGVELVAARSALARSGEVAASRAATAGPATAPATTPVTTPVTTPATTPQVSHPTLRYGSKGTAVLRLQRLLTEHGYWCGTPNGQFGPLTQQAVYAVQKAAGMRRTGVVGPKTWKRVEAGVRPRARTRSGRVIEVDIARQLLLLVKDGSVVRILNTSTGSGQRYWSPGSGSYAVAHTPRGSYRIYRRFTSGWQHGSLGSMYRPAYWHGGYAIHGSTSIPPWPASHGCCRVSTSAMDMLYRKGWVSRGRRVLVH